MTKRRPVNLVLIGPPGSGKGTQATRICQHFGIPWISTGDILRAAVKAGTPLGVQVQMILSSGGLVDDRMMIDLVGERLSRGDTATGFVLDGFPRTIAQADALDEMISGVPVCALVLDVPEAELIRRLTSRRICTKCKTLSTSRSLYGSEEELCSKCGSMLITRDDDNVVTIRRRLENYHSQTSPLIAHYEKRGHLKAIDGMRPPDEVTQALLAVFAPPPSKRESRKQR